MEWIGLAQDRDRWRTLLGANLRSKNCCKKCGIPQCERKVHCIVSCTEILWGARGRSEGRGSESHWCHWNFTLT